MSELRELIKFILSSRDRTRRAAALLVGFALLMVVMFTIAGGAGINWLTVVLVLLVVVMWALQSDSASRAMPRSARRAAGWAAWLLPKDDRERYYAEFLGELAELAQQRRSRRAQLSHAIRLLIRAPSLRLALRGSTQPERVR